MRIILIFCLLFSTQFLFSQTIFGKWKTVDRYGVEKCIIEIYKENNKVFGKIVDILVETEKKSLCVKCKVIEKDQPVLGLILIKELEKDGKYYRNGTIFDPEHGQTFRCRITLTNKNTLQVRGYLSFLYATQYWKRV